MWNRSGGEYDVPLLTFYADFTGNRRKSLWVRLERAADRLHHQVPDFLLRHWFCNRISQLLPVRLLRDRFLKLQELQRRGGFGNLILRIAMPAFFESRTLFNCQFWKQQQPRMQLLRSILYSLFRQTYSQCCKGCPRKLYLRAKLELSLPMRFVATH